MASLLFKYRNAWLLMSTFSALYVMTKLLDPSPDFLRFHFTDLLCIPLQLTLALTGARILKRNDAIVIPEIQIIGIVAGMSLLFEWYLPNYSENAERYTADAIDVMMYISGGMIFSVLQRTILQISVSGQKQRE